MELCSPGALVGWWEVVDGIGRWGGVQSERERRREDKSLKTRNREEVNGVVVWGNKED